MFQPLGLGVGSAGALSVGAGEVLASENGTYGGGEPPRMPWQVSVSWSSPMPRHTYGCELAHIGCRCPMPPTRPSRTWTTQQYRASMRQRGLASGCCQPLWGASFALTGTGWHLHSVSQCLDHSLQRTEGRAAHLALALLLKRPQEHVSTLPFLLLLTFVSPTMPIRALGRQSPLANICSTERQLRCLLTCGRNQEKHPPQPQLPREAAYLCLCQPASPHWAHAVPYWVKSFWRLGATAVG